MGLLAPDPAPKPVPVVPVPIPERTSVLANALDTLRQHHIPASRVIRVNTDCILYRQEDRCMTAWMRWTGSRLRIVAESGWPAEPARWVVHDLKID